MKILDALRIAQAPAADGAQPLSVAIACGFTPDQFQTMLVAHLRAAKPKRTVQASAGLFGDLTGNLQRLAQQTDKRVDAVVAAIEWSDLDARLGLRSLGGWAPEALADINQTVGQRLAQIEVSVASLARASIVGVSLPTLPLPPISFQPLHQAGVFETRLQLAVAEFAARLAAMERVRVVDCQALNRSSPPDQRLDVRSELTYGYPYRTPHGSALASLLAGLIDPPEPKKGLITDLDDTLWKGIVGEIGADNVTWTLDGHGQIHGLYQQMLQSLSGAGTLLAVASKNDPARVAEAFQRDDLVVKADRFFPIEASWGQKSAAVARIIRAWNVGADAVVFIDDSPLELAEVKAAHPQVECILFPKADEQAAFALIERLRSMFCKVALGAEDALRLESLRQGAELKASLEGADPSAFLSTIDAVIEISDERDPANRRPFELINKTNQFNLNGLRVVEAGWLQQLNDPEAFTLGIGYKDKFGPLGTIGVVSGRREGKTLRIKHWVMSCRAFSRQVEHGTLGVLLDRYGADAIVLDYEATAKNQPVLDFLMTYLGPGESVAKDLMLTRSRIKEAGPQTFHEIQEKTRG